MNGILTLIVIIDYFVEILLIQKACVQLGEKIENGSPSKLK
jgi:hypothetical protein